MLHSGLLRSRPLLAAAGRVTDKSQWRSPQSVKAVTSAQRRFADSKLPPPIVLPGTQSTKAPNTAPPPVITTTSPAAPTITTVLPPENVPRTPPTPEEVNATAPTSIVPPALRHLPPTIIPPTPIAPTPSTPAKIPPSTPPVQASPPTSKPPTNIIPPTGTGTASVASPARPKKRRRGRRFLLILTSVLGLSYAGGVYYSLINDNFHDFFTEHIPGGEEAVLFFEEREFKRRFPAGVSNPTRTLQQQVRGEKKVTISGKSGLQATIQEQPTDEGGSAKKTQLNEMDARLGKTDRAVAETKLPPTDSVSKVPQDSAMDPRLGKTDRAVGPPQNETPHSAISGPDGPGKTNLVAVGSEAIKDTKSAEIAGSDVKVHQGSAVDPRLGTTDRAIAETHVTPMDPRLGTTDRAMTGPQEHEAGPTPGPSKHIAPIDPLAVDNAHDPVVQEMTRILNDMISVANADEAQDKYSTTMAKAKDDLKKLAREIATYRAAEAKAAEEQIKQSHVEFENGAKELIRRIEKQQQDQEMQWKEEYDAERERLSRNYQEKLKEETEVAKKIADQRLRNELLQREIKLKESFTSSVRDRVETERSARLSKLSELSNSVSELEHLTAKWNDIVDSTLKTQHLVVAVESVRSILNNADRSEPFLHELAALKEIANDDPVVNAAISSINPSAYQLGVPTSAQLVDRFRRVASEVMKAALLPEDAGAASHAASFVLSKFLFKKNGLAVGEDVESILTRTEMLLEEGNLDEATREMNGLTGWAKVLSKDWLAECRRVLEVRQAIDVIATEARLQSLMVE